MVGVRVEVLRESGVTSLVGELRDDVMAVLASFSGSFHPFSTFAVSGDSVTVRGPFAKVDRDC
ncbi:hypothetical protein EEB14_29805 [Rhodococcus sp. WS4]|nr:hypothetical protein EEB14_29805 [Rhodococcus sp. WS4]